MSGGPTLPTFIEMPDGSQKTIFELTSGEMRAEAEARRVRGQKLIDETESLTDEKFTDEVESLMVQGRKLVEDAHWMSEAADLMDRQ